MLRFTYRFEEQLLSGSDVRQTNDRLRELKRHFRVLSTF